MFIVLHFCVALGRNTQLLLFTGFVGKKKAILLEPYLPGKLTKWVLNDGTITKVTL